MYYCPIMLGSVMCFVLFLLLHNMTTCCTCFLFQKGLWVYQKENSEEKSTGDICTLISCNCISMLNINLVYFYTIQSVVKCKNVNACVKDTF